MNQYIDIGEIIEIVPDTIKVVNAFNKKTPEQKLENNNVLNWVILGLVVIGTGYIAYKLYKYNNENTNISNKS